MTPDLWWMLAAGLVAAATTLLYACLQVSGAASDAADRALARCMILGVQLPLQQMRESLPPPASDCGTGDQR